MWDHVNKAMTFSRSTLDSDGFPKNFGVGHGWVEGGPLLPVRVELYMAGCYVEALRSLANSRAGPDIRHKPFPLEQEFDEQQQKLNTVFWLSATQNYAFAIGYNGTR